jgi:hypothetical protein
MKQRGSKDFPEVATLFQGDRVMFKKIVALAVVVAGLSLGTTVRAGEEATSTYWQALRAAGGNTEQLTKRIKTVNTPDELISLCRQLSTSMRQDCKEVNALPVLNVDPEVTAYAAQGVELVGQGASLFTDLADFVEEAKAYKDQVNSGEAFAEAFVRGFLGDPLGSYEDAKSKVGQFHESLRSLQERIRALDERGQKWDAQQITIRAQLSQRYNREFPRLDE